jgi:hypothetical protein
MRQREFIAGLGGAAAWTLTARAQQPDRMRRIGVLMGWNESEPEFRSWLTAFIQELMRLGWVDGRNLGIEVHWTNNDNDRTRIAAHRGVGVSEPGEDCHRASESSQRILKQQDREPPKKRQGWWMFPAAPTPKSRQSLTRWGNSRHVQQGTFDLRRTILPARRRPALVWSELRRYLPPRSRLCGPYPKRRETSRFASTGTRQVSPCNQSQNCKIIRPERAEHAAHHGRRGD